MNFDYKLIFKYILQNSKKIFLKKKDIKKNDVSIFIDQKFFYFILIHLKMSTFFYSTQLSEIFGYEINLSKNNYEKETKTKFFKNDTVLVYNFNLLKNNFRFFFFFLLKERQTIKNKTKKKTNINSISELFSNSNWLERETGELFGIKFINKKDTRNLMLQYGDSSSPFKKSYPCIGLKETFYDSNTDSLIQNQTSIQF